MNHTRPKMLTREEEIDLSRKARSGDIRARDVLILAHAPLVRAMAKRYRKLADFDDLTQEGMIGLMRAAEKFDPAEGTRFATCARWWVFAAISEHLRLNTSVVERNHVRFWRALKAGTLALDYALDAPVADGSSVTRGDLMPDTAALGEIDIIRMVDDEQVVRQVRRLLPKLLPTEQVVIKRLYLCKPKKETTQSNLAREFGLSPQRVQQIERSARTKIAAALRASLEIAA